MSHDAGDALTAALLGRINLDLWWCAALVGVEAVDLAAFDALDPALLQDPVDGDAGSWVNTQHGEQHAAERWWSDALVHELNMRVVHVTNGTVWVGWVLSNPFFPAINEGVIVLVTGVLDRGPESTTKVEVEHYNASRPDIKAAWVVRVCEGVSSDSEVPEDMV